MGMEVVRREGREVQRANLCTLGEASEKENDS